jgi:hypothetical protein
MVTPLWARCTCEAPYSKVSEAVSKSLPSEYSNTQQDAINTDQSERFHMNNSETAPETLASYVEGLVSHLASPKAANWP